jgi:Flp pilus assembly protein TadG
LNRKTPEDALNIKVEMFCMLMGTGRGRTAAITGLFRRRTERPTGKPWRFVRNQDGSAAVEFGMVAAPFLALMFAILETALVLFATQTLETAVTDSARLIMTGQAQAAQPGKPKGMTADDFKIEVCKRVYALFDCAGKLQVDARVFNSFSAISFANPLDENGNFIPPVYNAGVPGDIVAVRLMYQWPIYADLLGYFLSNVSGSTDRKRLLIATAVFRNEPYL